MPRPSSSDARRHQRTGDQGYYYEYYLYCPNCCTLYMLDEAKRPYQA